MNRHFNLSVLFALAALSSLPACMNSPRNGQVISGLNDPFPMSGAVTYPNDTLTLQVMNQITGDWYGTGYATTSSASPNTTDAQGVSWYFYNTTARLTHQKHLWRKARTRRGQRRVTATVRTQSKKGNGPLYSFDQNIDDCVETYRSQGGIAIAQNCHARKSPNAQVVVHCGQADQACCIAHDLSDAEACDDGRICGTDKRCSVPAGDAGQPCNADGSCGGELSCVSGTCRDTTKDEAPIYSLDLEVRTCDDTNWLTGGHQFKTVRFGARDNPDYQVLDQPGNDNQAGQWQRYSLVLAAPTTLGELGDMWISTGAGYWCFDEIRLHANDEPIFSRSFSSPVYMRAVYPENRASWKLAGADIRDGYLAGGDLAVCNAPETRPGAELERIVEAAFANFMSETTEVGWGDSGWVQITRRNADQIELRAKVSVSPHEVPVTVDAYVRTYLSFGCSCTGTPCNGEVSIDMAPLELLDIEGGAGYNVVNIVTFGALERLGEGLGQEMLDDLGDQLDLGTFIKGLPACPSFEIVPDADGTAALEIGYPVDLPDAIMCPSAF